MNRILEELKAERQIKGLKQSSLGEKLGLPQSHVSKIEQGGTDPRLSTVTEMARLLDHELVLVPRQLVPAIRAIISGQDTESSAWQPDEEHDV
jgi:transcriptional regulator with XRE-family HTH domain